MYVSFCACVHVRIYVHVHVGERYVSFFFIVSWLWGSAVIGMNEIIIHNVCWSGKEGEMDLRLIPRTKTYSLWVN